MSEFSRPLATPQQNRLFHVIHDICFLIRIFNSLVVVREVEDDFAMVVDEPRAPSLEKERSDPRVLPVDYARNVAILGEEIVWSYVPVPDCWAARGGSLWREI
jgi:hypothetical protein